MNTTQTSSAEPLKTDPQWERINNSPWTSQSNTSDGSIYHPPQAYAKGFEEGAYALAKEILRLFKDKQDVEAYKLLLQYEAGQARPTFGWQHEAHK
jgi:hypothetical protein